MARRQARGRRRPWLVSATRLSGRGLGHVVLRLRVAGTEHVPARGAVILAGNHAGFLDGPLVYLLSPRPVVLLAKSELFVGPLARALGWLGQVPVHRGRPDRSALRAGLQQLADGGALGVFPEGTRGSGTFDEVADGLAYLALRSGAPVVPVAVVGSAAAWPRGARRPRWRAPVSVAFGAPVTITTTGDPRSRRTVSLVAEELRLALVDHLRTTTGERA